jgi:hypothetical protein
MKHESEPSADSFWCSPEFKIFTSENWLVVGSKASSFGVVIHIFEHVKKQMP